MEHSRSEKLMNMHEPSGVRCVNTTAVTSQINNLHCDLKVNSSAANQRTAPDNGLIVT